MKFFVGYATVEGQSRKIARWVADHLSDRGQTVEVMALSDATDLDMSRFDRAVLVSSIHANGYRTSFIRFLEGRAAELERMPACFLSVSLAAAGHDAEDWKGLDDIVADLGEATGWKPAEVHHVAGAYVPSKYDLFTRFIMRRILAEKDPDADLYADKEYTDWDALGEIVDGLVQPVSA